MTLLEVLTLLSLLGSAIFGTFMVIWTLTNKKK